MLPDETLRKETQILAVSIDTHAESQTLKKRWRTLVTLTPEEEQLGEIAFPLLEDRDSQVIARYGLLNPRGLGWPHPTTYVIDKAGIVRWKFVETDFTVRPTNSAILEAIQAAQHAYVPQAQEE